MVLALVAAKSRVMVDVRSKGIVAALDHELTFTGVVDACALGGALSELDAIAASDNANDAARAIELTVDATMPVAGLQPPADASRFDRDKMIDNLRGKDVLDASRFPSLAFRGRYVGTLERGALDGALVVRDTPRALRLDVRVTRNGDVLRAEGAWEGTLTELGIKPFKALFGALKLADWVRIRIDATFAL